MLLLLSLKKKENPSCRSRWVVGGLLGSGPPPPVAALFFLASPLPPSSCFLTRCSGGLRHRGSRSGAVSLGTPEKRGGGVDVRFLRSGVVVEVSIWRQIWIPEVDPSPSSASSTFCSRRGREGSLG
ncbi:hypothetical protein F2Q68_00027270 [Brassica cretica]|uniref:Uncharacterized protein n=1 Tax=Brassica cretica TaxID=69181 RepID=A0A8S9IC59_BRACR|nr:hypothetical protein F2Q68_00027270 [Brassica cretica]